MATEAASAPLNGTYAPHQSHAYGASENNYTANNVNTATTGTSGANSSTAAPTTYGSAVSTTSTQTASGNGASDVPKDEVGWYFVEQYYTTLSRNPEKLFLFYNKRSQFVSGVEEEKVSVCIGQKAINDRIKELDFQDCKVRVTNVDSQGSDQSIVIQVIGEISNKHAPHRKFVQTFVLAEQTNGYFVLNDIFRYITEEDVEAEGEAHQEEAPTVAAGYQEPTPSMADAGDKDIGTATAGHNLRDGNATAQVDKELEDIKKHENDTPTTDSSANTEINGKPTTEDIENVQSEESTVATEKPSVTEPVNNIDTDATEDEGKASEPEPERAPTPKAAVAAPATAPKPAAPKTWASLAASAIKPATPNVGSSTSQQVAPSQTKPNPQLQQSNNQQVPVSTQSATPSAPARESSPATSQNDSTAGWQTADHSKRQSRTQPQAVSESQMTRAYIKNVYESVDGDALKSTLAKYGEILYCDISRQKNCAFVDFATLQGFQAAVAANPHRIGDDTINVEERRTRPGQYTYVPRGGQRGGRGGPDGRQPTQGRGGYKQDGGRGGFPRGRGGNFTPRGRGSS